MYYIVKTKKTEPDKKGLPKNVRETFLAEAETVVEAATLVMKETDGELTGVTEQPLLKEVFNEKEEDKPFFKLKLVDQFEKDDGTVKEMVYYALVCAADCAEATRVATEQLKQGYGDIRLDDVQKTKIVALV